MTPPFIIMRMNTFTGGHACSNAYSYPRSLVIHDHATADAACAAWLLPMQVAFRLATCEECQYLNVTCEANDGTTTVFGTALFGPAVFGLLAGDSLPPKDVAVLCRHTGAAGLYPPGSSRVSALGHSFISGIPETRCNGGEIDPSLRPAIGQIGETARVQFGGEHLWSKVLNRWVPIQVYSLRSVIKVIRRRSKRSS